MSAPEEVTIEQLTPEVLQLTGSRSEVSFITYDQVYEQGFEDMACRVPDISKAKHFIGFTPTIDRRAILESVIAYYREEPQTVSAR